MTEYKQKIEILKLLGWKLRQTGIDKKDTWTSPDGVDFTTPPEITLDLLHEVEKLLDTKQAFDYMDRLRPIGVSYWRLVHVTKERKAECILKTLKLWEG